MKKIIVILAMIFVVMGCATYHGGKGYVVLKDNQKIEFGDKAIIMIDDWNYLITDQGMKYTIPREKVKTFFIENKE